MKQQLAIITLILLTVTTFAQKHNSKNIMYPSYNGLVMCGYQGWFRAEGDAANQHWGHYGHSGKFDPTHLTVDIWPEVDEYNKTYETAFINADGSKSEVFSPLDASTVDVHFKWMKEYGINGVFMQRFFGTGRNEQTRKVPDMVLKNGFDASQKYERAIAIMYDLSGLNPGKDDCNTIIEDWKHLVNDLKVTSYEKKQTYLHHNNKPVVAIWGVGFPDRPYNIHNIELEKLIDFLKNDPVYGGCAVMMGVPTYFRDLDSDCITDPYLHDLIRSVDIVMPWMVGRFTLNVFSDMERHAALITKDLKWCKENKVDYVPCVFPGFSWYNLSVIEFEGKNQINQIPRHGGRFFWEQICNAVKCDAPMIYVAMFDEIDEATAIFKCTNTPPVNAKFIDYEGYPSDLYLKLTGLGGKMLRKEIPLSTDLYKSAQQGK